MQIPLPKSKLRQLLLASKSPARTQSKLSGPTEYTQATYPLDRLGAATGCCRGDHSQWFRLVGTPHVLAQECWDVQVLSVVRSHWKVLYGHGTRRDPRLGSLLGHTSDQGWLLLWPAVPLVLFWFRRGWTMQWQR